MTDKVMNFIRLLASISIVFQMLTMSHATGATWECTWKAVPGEDKAVAVVTPLKYGKLWAYAVELDDGGKATGLYAPDFFGNYHFTDAPPGIKGGKDLPIVGSLAVIVGGIARNNTVVGFDILRALSAKGWNITNHSFSHRGRSWGNPPDNLSPEQIREDLFWSQAILAVELGADKVPTHFVYPNGYIGYGPFLKEFGLFSGSLVGGSGGKNMASDKFNPLYLARNYMDQAQWKQAGRGDPMHGLKSTPKANDLVIDFTHGLSRDPGNENFQLWHQRMETISAQWGSAGTDEFWSAPVEQVINYHFAAQNAKVKLVPGKLSVTLPEDQPGSALTLRIDHLPEAVQLATPENGAIYRQGSTAWITTPPIGRLGSPVPPPKVKRAYKGIPQEIIQLPGEAKIAAVALKFDGSAAGNELVKVEVLSADGKATGIGKEETLAKGWASGYQLYSAVPNESALLGRSVRISRINILREVEIWTVE